MSNEILIQQYEELLAKAKSSPTTVADDASKQRKVELKELMRQLQSGEIKEQADILKAVTRVQELHAVSKTTGSGIKQEVLELRDKILSSKEFCEGWESFVEFFKKEPMALKALVYQTEVDLDEVLPLPFRKGGSGGTKVGAGIRYDYLITLEDGEKVKAKRISEAAGKFDGSRKPNISWASLQKLVGKAKIGDVLVTDISREAREEDDAEEADEEGDSK